jgi:iron complex outermembrane receptor protein
LLNLSASWTKVYGKPFDLQLYASNVTNIEYLTQASPSWMPGLGYTTQVFGEPRMYGVRLNYRLGADAK